MLLLIKHCSVGSNINTITSVWELRKVLLIFIMLQTAKFVL